VVVAVTQLNNIARDCSAMDGRYRSMCAYRLFTVRSEKVGSDTDESPLILRLVVLVLLAYPGRPDDLLRASCLRLILSQFRS
jgi:hypothetical protein